MSLGENICYCLFIFFLCCLRFPVDILQLVDIAFLVASDDFLSQGSYKDKNIYLTHFLLQLLTFSLLLLSCYWSHEKFQWVRAIKLIYFDIFVLLKELNVQYSF